LNIGKPRQIFTPQYFAFPVERADVAGLYETRDRCAAEHNEGHHYTERREKKEYVGETLGWVPSVVTDRQPNKKSC
jgi:hypothetical protein